MGTLYGCPRALKVVSLTGSSHPQVVPAAELQFLRNRSTLILGHLGAALSSKYEGPFMLTTSVRKDQIEGSGWVFIRISHSGSVQLRPIQIGLSQAELVFNEWGENWAEMKPVTAAFRPL